MLACLVQPSLTIGQVAIQKMPFGVLLRGGAEKLLRTAQISYIDTLAHLDKNFIARRLLLIGILTLVPLLLGTVVARLPTASGPGTGNGVVSLVNLFHLFFRQICQGVILIIVRMVLPGQFPVCPLDLVVTGGRVHAQYAVWIVNPLFLLRFF